MYGTSRLQPESYVKRVSRGIAGLLYEDRATSTSPGSPVSDPPLHSTGVVLSPAGTLLTRRRASPGDRRRQKRHLAVAIRQRIETRLGTRITSLAVEVDENMVVLNGNCATYYSKQLAQHAALGVIEDEHLVNEIVVAVPE